MWGFGLVPQNSSHECSKIVKPVSVLASTTLILWPQLHIFSVEAVRVCLANNTNYTLWFLSLSRVFYYYIHFYWVLLKSH